jgi:vancomycin permeability regulator SanA
MPAALPSARQFAHAVVVLGCPANPDGTPSRALERRLRRALEELERDPGALAVVTGGAVANAVAEAHAMKRWLVEHGVDAQRIWVEDRARFTLDNANRVAPLIARSGASRVTVVTEEFHAPRGTALVRAALRRLGLGKVQVSSSAAPDRLSHSERAERARDEARKLARDLAALTMPEPRGHFFDPSVFSRAAMAA